MTNKQTDKEITLTENMIDFYESFQKLIKQHDLTIRQSVEGDIKIISNNIDDSDYNLEYKFDSYGLGHQVRKPLHWLKSLKERLELLYEVAK